MDKGPPKHRREESAVPTILLVGLGAALAFALIIAVVIWGPRTWPI